VSTAAGAAGVASGPARAGDARCCSQPGTTATGSTTDFTTFTEPTAVLPGWDTSPAA